MTAEDVMCKMVELLSAPFSLSTGIRSCFEFHGGREGEAADSLRAVIKKQPFVCALEMGSFSISPNKLVQGLAMVIKIKCPLFHSAQNSGYLENALEFCPVKLEALFIVLECPWSFKIRSCIKESRTAVSGGTVTMKSHVTRPEGIFKRDLAPLRKLHLSPPA